MERHQMINAFYESDEYKDLNLLFDLNNDPMEELNVMKNESQDKHRKTFQIMKEKIDTIANLTPFHEQEEIMFQSEDEQRKMEKHQKGLGYL